MTEMKVSIPLEFECLYMAHKLDVAIKDHNKIVRSLRINPSDTVRASTLTSVQRYIISISRWQKKLIYRLNEEKEEFAALHSVKPIVKLPFELRLFNNNDITNNYEKGFADFKIDAQALKAYEETWARETRPRSTDSNDSLDFDEEEDEEVEEGEEEAEEEEVSKRQDEKEESKKPEEESFPTSSSDESELTKELREEEYTPSSNLTQEQFLGALGIITHEALKLIEAAKQGRKRRSTANPNFSYATMTNKQKKKKTEQYPSDVSAPQTRQAAAKSKNPSPPPTNGKGFKVPIKTKKTLLSAKRQKPQPKQSAKSVAESCDVQQSKKQAKPDKNMLKITGLPSGLTIERIDESIVCITCQTPGSLRACDICSANFHLTCHSGPVVSPTSCPKCVQHNRTSFCSISSLGSNKEDRSKERYELRERNSELKLQRNYLEKTYRRFSDILQVGSIGSATDELPKGSGRNSTAETRKISGKIKKISATKSIKTYHAPVEFDQLPLSTSIIPIDSNNKPIKDFFQVTKSTNKRKRKTSLLLDQLRKPRVHDSTERKPVSEENNDGFIIIGGIPPIKERRWSSEVPSVEIPVTIDSEWSHTSNGISELLPETSTNSDGRSSTNSEVEFFIIPADSKSGSPEIIDLEPTAEECQKEFANRNVESSCSGKTNDPGAPFENLSEETKNSEALSDLERILSDEPKNRNSSPECDISAKILQGSPVSNSGISECIQSTSSPNSKYPNYLKLEEANLSPSSSGELTYPYLTIMDTSDTLINSCNSSLEQDFDQLNGSKIFENSYERSNDIESSDEKYFSGDKTAVDEKIDMCTELQIESS